MEQLQQADIEDCSLKVVNHPVTGSASAAFDRFAGELLCDEEASGTSG